ncbi:Radical SAM [Dillenia turbinata]|uniref:Radical S-adenosyl methionine domain-containing protein 1, mitochondrial n=1 Tax=Dillenia turbinata TaxID=194707 RepID=A0AAN8Z6Y2_9MAGN
MMLKTTYGPILSPILTQTKKLRLSKYTTNAIAQTPPTVHQNASTNLSTIPSYKLPPTSAYIHLPFCRKRCYYCDFPIVALGSSSTQSEDDPRILNYIQLLCQEIKATPVANTHQNPPLNTVFFGGGTPSLVPPRLVSLVLDTLRLKFGISSDVEMSMEMDPGTFDARKMERLIELGVNRVSLGVQAFQEELLKACGRAHGLREVYDAIKIVKSSGVENWSLDLISSLPHQTIDMWEDSLRCTVEMQPTHVSVYDLQVEQGTKFGILYTPGEFPLPSENQSADFYRTASRAFTDAGYEHYEISSYCKKGFQCKHNFTYWENKSFYGFGLGSASYVGGLRFSRPRKMKEYKNYVQDLEREVWEHLGDNHVDAKDMAMDVVMLSLRTARGLDLVSFGEAFGHHLLYSLCKAYQPYVESGHVVCLDRQREVIEVKKFKTLVSNESGIQDVAAYIRLSDPDGFLLSNELISFAFAAMAP